MKEKKILLKITNKTDKTIKTKSMGNSVLLDFYSLKEKGDKFSFSFYKKGDFLL